MNAYQYTFRKLLSGGKDDAGHDIRICRIVIPMIQRDYAQGRRDKETSRVREDFLQSLHDVVNNPEASITLDFVYGSVVDGTLTPLDGQQRLTTLYLLYWYAGMKDDRVSKEDMAFLKQFSYETRHSARDFCRKLTDFPPFEKMPAHDQKISETIIDQKWFPPEWKKDPTVSSMMVMLDDIHQQFYHVPDMWERLENISFYFLPMDDMGLTDELYIKMNSRGRPLTDFEHFKAQLSKQLKACCPDTEKRILEKIDIAWTDMLWTYRGNDIIDEEFIQYFKFICDVIYYKEYGEKEEPEKRIYNEYDLLQRYFSGDKASIEKHIAYLEQYFDCWCKLEADGKPIKPVELVGRYIAHQHEKGKITVSEKEDIFTQCLNGYADQNERKYPLTRFLLLYAFVQYLIHRENDEVQLNFPRRLRIVNNLISNSGNEIREDGTRISRITVMMEQIDRIILEGKVDADKDNGFNAYQLKEEKAKLEWTKKQTDEECEKLFALEDHKLLYGQVGILCYRNGKFDLEQYVELFPRFAELFSCEKDEDWDRVDRALVSLGYYGQHEHGGWRYQFGTKTHNISDPWQSLFHYSANRDYSNTQDVLIPLLQKYEHLTTDALDKIISDFMQDCVNNRYYCWRYYYVKYDVFRGGYYGKYSTIDKEQQKEDCYMIKDYHYMIYVMTTRYKWSAFTYMPYLQAAKKILGGEVKHNVLSRNGWAISCYNKGYKIDGIAIDALIIDQNDEGIDEEDRVEKLVKCFNPKAEL